MDKSNSTRAGRYLRQPGGYLAFVPKPLPPDPPLRLEPPLLSLLSQADLALGRLDGIAETIPDPDFFLAMYVRKEAVLSSQIEGTQASLQDLLAYEAQSALKKLPADVSEVVRYVEAINYGLARLQEFPLSLRLLREIHARLLASGRGAEKDPGEFRRSQNWLGPAGCTLKTASFVPPPVPEMHTALGELEKYLYADDPLPVLLKCGLIHYQFETIHPFLDGNGRLGRLLITLYLCQQGVLRRPLLYLSYYFKQHRQEYYDRLSAVREQGDWEGWLHFFLRGVVIIAQEAAAIAQQILRMRQEHQLLLAPRTAQASAILELLYRQPLVTINLIKEKLQISFAGASRLAQLLVEQGLLRELTGRSRNRLFAYLPYLALFLDEPGDLEVAALWENK